MDQNLRKFKIKCTRIHVPWKSRHGVAGSTAKSASDRVSGIIYNECTLVMKYHYCFCLFYN